MPDTAAPKFDLKRKIGPFPLWAWIAVGGGAIYLYERNRQSSSSGAGTAQQQASLAQQTGYGTDPAGNVGYIDPSTGYVYGSTEDIAALQAQNQAVSGSAATGSASGGSGDTGTTDTSGTTAQAGQATGATNASGTSVSTPGGGTSPPSSAAAAAAPAASSKNWQYPAPQGLQAFNTTDSGTALRWNAVQGPGGQKPGTYTVQTWQGTSTKVDQFTSGSTSTQEYGSGGKGLKPSTEYRVDVWANGGPVAPPHASITFTTKPKGSK